MEKWKIAIIGVLLLGLVGYGVSQQQTVKPLEQVIASLTPSVPNAPGKLSASENDPAQNKAAVFVGQKLGGTKVPAWKDLGPWVNSPAPVTLDSLQGKPALIEFFRINCQHCQEAAPFMEALYKRYKPRGLKMVAVQSPGNYKDKTNQETMWPQVKDWVNAGGLTYPVGMDENSAYFQQTLNGAFYPTIMIANASGAIVHAETGHDLAKAISLAVELEKLLPGAGTPKARAQDLAKFLRPFVFGNDPVDPTIYKSLTDDLEQRLMNKV